MAAPGPADNDLSLAEAKTILVDYVEKGLGPSVVRLGRAKLKNAQTQEGAGRDERCPALMENGTGGLRKACSHEHIFIMVSRIPSLAPRAARLRGAETVGAARPPDTRRISWSR